MTDYVQVRNRRYAGDTYQIYCSKCGQWKDANPDNFYSYGGKLSSPCKVCILKSNKVRKSSGIKCHHVGCDRVLNIDNTSGYCGAHANMHRGNVVGKPKCNHCGGPMKYWNGTGLCRTCYIATGKAKEIRANSAPPGAIKNADQPYIELPVNEFYSGLGQLPAPMGIAICQEPWRKK
jgi:hypothetical protein